MAADGEKQMAVDTAQLSWPRRHEDVPVAHGASYGDRLSPRSGRRPAGNRSPGGPTAEVTSVATVTISASASSGPPSEHEIPRCFTTDTLAPSGGSVA